MPDSQQAAAPSDGLDLDTWDGLDPDDPTMLLRRVALLSLIALPVLALMTVFNLLEEPLVMGGSTLALTALVAWTRWWILHRPNAYRARTGAMIILISALIVMSLISFAEMPEGFSTPFWMGLVILGAANILGVRAAVVVTGIATLGVAIAFASISVVEPFGTPLVEFLTTARRVLFLLAVLAMAVAARRISDRQLLSVRKQRETIRRQASDLEEEVGQRKKAEEELARSLASVITSATDGIITYSEDGTVLDANVTARRMIGGANLVGGKLSDLLARVEPESGLDPHLPLDGLTRSGSRVEIALPTSSSGTEPVDTEWAVSSREAGDRTVFMAIIRDITERKSFEETLYRQANFDSLTGLPNRFYVGQVLGRLMSERSAETGVGGVLAVNLDDFRTVQDSLGFQSGEEILRVIGKRLSALVGERDVLARTGGDGFLILCRGRASEETLARLAVGITSVLAEPVDLGGKHVALTACIGIATNDGSRTRPDEYLRDAGAAVNRAKQRGRGHIQIYDEQIRRDALLRLDIDNGLRTALSGEEFALWYQPIVSVATRRTIGAEALLRWMRPGSGVVPPDMFLPRLEAIGLIHEVGNWVLARACQDLADWQARRRSSGDTRHPPTISVNVSALQVGAEGLQEAVWSAISRNGLTPSHLTLEITESALFDPRFEVHDTLEGFRDAGVKIAIDDFGTGYSTLSQLRNLNADVLKLDKSFIRHIDSDVRDRAIADAVITLAQRFSMPIVAEGVETEAQLTTLREIGCERAQGYLFARPAPPEVTLVRSSDGFRRVWGRSRVDVGSLSGCLMADVASGGLRVSCILWLPGAGVGFQAAVRGSGCSGSGSKRSQE